MATSNVRKEKKSLITVSTLRFIRTLFLASYLGLAIYFTSSALESWNEAPIVTSVDQLEIGQVAFPAVTVCHPLSWKWQGLVSAIGKSDHSGQIKRDFIEKADLYYQDIRDEFIGKFVHCGNKVKGSYKYCPHFALMESNEFLDAKNTSANTLDLAQKILGKDFLPSIYLLHYFIFRTDFLASGSEMNSIKPNLRNKIMEEAFYFQMLGESFKTTGLKIQDVICRENQFIILSGDLGPKVCQEWKPINHSLYQENSLSLICEPFKEQSENEVSVIIILLH